LDEEKFAINAKVPEEKEIKVRIEFVWNVKT
jgi:hypothetical protein